MINFVAFWTILVKLRYSFSVCPLRDSLKSPSILFPSITTNKTSVISLPFSVLFWMLSSIFNMLSLYIIYMRQIIIMSIRWITSMISQRLCSMFNAIRSTPFLNYRPIAGLTVTCISILHSSIPMKIRQVLHKSTVRTLSHV